MDLREAVDLLKPEAEEICQAAKADLTTKNGYGTVMNSLSRVPFLTRMAASCSSRLWSSVGIREKLLLK